MQAYSLKFIRWIHDIENKKGAAPIYLRITVNRKVKYIDTNFKCSQIINLLKAQI